MQDPQNLNDGGWSYSPLTRVLSREAKKIAIISEIDHTPLTPENLRLVMQALNGIPTTIRHDGVSEMLRIDCLTQTPKPDEK